jgi:hypothetical protein
MRMSARERVDDAPDDNARLAPALAGMLGPRVSDLDRLVIARSRIDQDANPRPCMRIGPLKLRLLFEGRKSLLRRYW